LSGATLAKADYIICCYRWSCSIHMG